jgi:hypothetical protein
MKTSIVLSLICAAVLAATPNLAARTAGWQPLLGDPVGDPYDFRSFVSLAFTKASGTPVDAEPSLVPPSFSVRFELKTVPL